MLSQLIDHLRQTGTGKAKLDCIAAIAGDAPLLDRVDEIARELRAIGHGATADKVQAFVSSLPLPGDFVPIPANDDERPKRPAAAPVRPGRPLQPRPAQDDAG